MVGCCCDMAVVVVVVVPDDDRQRVSGWMDSDSHHCQLAGKLE